MPGNIDAPSACALNCNTGLVGTFRILGRGGEFGSYLDCNRGHIAR